MKAFNCTPYEVLVENIVKSDGCYLFDGDGKKYLDLESGVWCTALGHNHPAVQAAMQNQMARISHVGYRYSHSVVEQAAGMMLDTLAMANGKCVFLSSGSEAVEFAVQAAKRVTGEEKPYMLCLNQYFLSSYGISASRPSSEWITVEATQGDGQSWLEEVEAIPFEKVGAFVFEPGNASGLVRLPPKGLIDHIVKKVKEHGGLVVVDEVTTGIGRTGKWFGFEHYDIAPDMVVCGKGIGNGYPVSCVAMNSYLAEKLLQTGFRYAQSHQNDPLGCAVVCAVLSQVQKEGLVAQAAGMGEHLMAQLAALAERENLISEVRGRGLMVAIELRPEVPIEKIHGALCEKGFMVGLNLPNRVLRLYPPLVVTQRVVDAFILGFEEVLGQFTGKDAGF